ncbi:MAG: hypothetical protein HW421_3065 [Ignavibacteria bacterium]|nr:hypothetical protein [Ignavibacteria bacterium]
MKKLMFAAILMFISLNVVSLVAMETVWSKQAHTGSLLLFKTSPDEKYIYTIGADKIYKKWDAKTGDMLEQKELKFDFDAADINADGKIIYYGNYKDTVCRFYSYHIIKDSSELIEQYTQAFFLKSNNTGSKYIIINNIRVLLHPDNTRLYFWMSFNYWHGFYNDQKAFDGYLVLLDQSKKIVFKEIDSLFAGIINLSNDGKKIALNSYIGSIGRNDIGFLYSIKYNFSIYYEELQKEKNISEESFIHITFSPDSKYISTCTRLFNNKNYIKIWDNDQNKLISNWLDSDTLISSQFSNDSKFLIISKFPNLKNKNNIINIINIRYVGHGNIIDSLPYQNKFYFVYPSNENLTFYTFSSDM